jgi:hypothetical protein
MASNSATIQDPIGNGFEDWIELYNPGNVAVDLSGYFITDDLADPFKSPVPAGAVISPGGYLIVWATGDRIASTSPENEIYAEFRLGRGGESIGLVSPGGEFVDFLEYGEQTADISEGRLPDGGSMILKLDQATPGYSNAGLVSRVRIDSISMSLDVVTIVWGGLADSVYEVQATQALDSGPWTPLGRVSAEVDGSQHFEFEIDFDPVRFIRVVDVSSASGI